MYRNVNPTAHRYCFHMESNRTPHCFPQTQIHLARNACEHSSFTNITIIERSPESRDRRTCTQHVGHGAQCAVPRARGTLPREAPPKKAHQKSVATASTGRLERSPPGVLAPDRFRLSADGQIHMIRRYMHTRYQGKF